MRKQVYLTKSSQETKKLAEQIGKDFKNGGVLALFGNLGSGKTTFVQGFAESLEIKQRIISPTFIIVREYQISNIKYPISNFYHVDLYRIESSKEIKGLGLEEIINSKSRIIAIEWAEKVKNLLPEKRIEIYFEYISDNERKITVHKYG